MPTAIVTPFTFASIAEMNQCDQAVGLIDEASKAHPEIAAIPVRTIKGVNFKTLVRTANPTAGFRAANAGVTSSRGTYESRLVETFILNPRWDADKAVADGYEDGPEAFIAMEASGMTNAAFKAACAQIYYGGDANGFPALSASVLAGQTIDAGGTTAATGSSVYALKFGPQGVQWVIGNNGALEISEARIESVDDGTGKKYTAYVQELLSRIGMQVGNLKGLGRIKDLTEDAGKGLTDDLLADLLATFEVGYKPDVLIMSRRSRKQLQKSRTATNATGAPAPTPLDYEGIPIIASDSILDTEALTA